MVFTVENSLKTINQEIKMFNFGSEPSNLYDPIQYIMGLGGKRLRPLLVLLSHQLFSADPKAALLPAVAVEVFHNFTLVHDDIMDHAPLRRGKPTVHEKWNTNVAILSGDVMLIKAYQLLVNIEEKYISQVFTSFNLCASQVCEGQQLDVNYEKDSNVTLANYMQMITLKTAVLLGFSAELGAIIGGAKLSDIELLKKFGIAIGVAFQLKDDLLDVFGDQAKFGKKVGGDIIAKKKTFLLLKALELAKGQDQQYLQSFLGSEELVSDEQVEKITELFQKLDLQKITETKILEFFNQGIHALSKVNAPLYRKKIIKDFVIDLMRREN